MAQSRFELVHPQWTVAVAFSSGIFSCQPLYDMFSVQCEDDSCIPRMGAKIKVMFLRRRRGAHAV